MPEILKTAWATSDYVTDPLHVLLVRELAALHFICPESCKLGMVMSTGELYEQYGNSALHWSRCFEWPWALLNSDLTKDCVCLDAAGGHAVFQQSLARRVKSVVNIDRNEKSLNAAKYLASAIGNVNLTTRVGDLGGIPPKNDYEKYDRVFCISVMEHCIDWIAILDHLLYTLKPGGILILTMDVVRSDLKQTDHRASGFHIGFEEANQVCEMLGGEFPVADRRLMANKMPCGTILSCLVLKVRK